MKKKKSTLTQQTSTGTAVLSSSISYKIPLIPGSPGGVRPKLDSYFEKGTFISEWLKRRTWLKKSKKFGKTRTCRLCDKQLKREEYYLHLDQQSFRVHTAKNNSYIQTHKAPVQITICGSCVDNWSKELHKLNNDMQRSSAFEC